MGRLWLATCAPGMGPIRASQVLRVSLMEQNGHTRNEENSSVAFTWLERRTMAISWNLNILEDNTLEPRFGNSPLAGPYVRLASRDPKAASRSAGMGASIQHAGRWALARAVGGQAQHIQVPASPRNTHGGMAHMGLQRTGSMPPACFALPRRFQAVCVGAGFLALLCGAGLGALLVPTNIRPTCALDGPWERVLSQAVHRRSDCLPHPQYWASKAGLDSSHQQLLYLDETRSLTECHQYYIFPLRSESPCF